MTPNFTRIVAAVVDTRNLTLYKENGETIIIPQGDARLRRIVEEAAPQLIRQNWADVVIDIPEENSYAKFEQEGNGVVKFFRIAKTKLKELLVPPKPNEPAVTISVSPVLPMAIGAVPAIQGALHDSQSEALAFAEAHMALGNVLNAVAISKGKEDIEVAMDQLRENYGTSDSTTPVSDHIATAGIYDVSEMDEVEAAMEQAPAAAPAVVKVMSAIDEIIKHAVPVDSPDFHERGLHEQGKIVEDSGTTIQKHPDALEEDTIIAVVDGKVIPGMELIKTQFARAAKLGSTIGVEKFLQRLAAVIEHRSHSVEDLLKFMERGDLPIADDGTIIIYKILKRVNNSTEKYVDCHSGKVEQWVGAYVCMDEKLVDHNRNQECSNGLHVARRGYLSGFSGNVCVLAKLAPEDVIAVPTYDANKMRVCGYHILFELTEDQFKEVRGNRPLTSTPEGKALLGKALAGDHIHKTDEVRITSSMGQGVINKKLTAPKAAPIFKDESTPTPSLFPPTDAVKGISPFKIEETPLVVADALDNPGVESKDTPVDPMAVVKTVENAVISRKDQAKVLYDTWFNGHVGGVVIDKDAALVELMAYKKAAKISWEKLGIPDPTAAGTKPMTSAVKGKGKQPKPQKFVAPIKANDQARKPNSSKGTKVSAGPVTPVPAVSTTETRTAIAVEVELGEGGPKLRISKLLEIGLESEGIAKQILKIKQQARKSWALLGVSDDQVAKIMKLAGPSQH